MGAFCEGPAQDHCRQAALANEVPQGAYIQEVVAGSSAEEAGIQAGDILTKVDGKQLKEDLNLAEIINKKKVGDALQVTYWRDGETIEKNVTLKKAE